MFELYNDDCLKVMPNIPDKSIDMILCDLPYGVTRNKWDTVIPFEELWLNYNRIIKDNGVICLFADGMFMAKLMVSNEKMWRYNLVWDKKLVSGFLNANRMPLRRHEEICVFYKKLPTYNPQKIDGGVMNHTKGSINVQSSNYGNYGLVDNREELGTMKHPTSIISISRYAPTKLLHPTEKPVELCEWLIKTYTNEGETVLDNCMGCGSTGVACKNTNRNFIGIELNKEYFGIAEGRIEDV